MNSIQQILPREIIDIIMETTGEYKQRKGVWIKQISRDRIMFLEEKIKKAPVKQQFNGRNVWSAFIYLGTPGNAVLMKQHDKRKNTWILKYNKIVNSCVSVTTNHEIL